MHRLYISYSIPDARAKLKKKQFDALGLKSKIGAVYLADCFVIDTKLTKEQLEKTKALLTNPLMQRADSKLITHNSKLFSHAIEIGFLPGVTDNISHTAKETISASARVKFQPGQSIYSSRVFFIVGNVSRGDAVKIANTLYNPLIQRATITTFEQFKKLGELPLVFPKVKIKGSSKVSKVDLDVADDELIKLGKLGIKNIDGSRRGPLALSLAELTAIKNYFSKLKRKPTDVELEALAQTWSEHCKHTIFSDPIDELKDGIYRTYIKAATEAVRKQKGKEDFCVSVFTDNAGGIKFDSNYILAHKVETHNTPSALDPFGGSLTGIGGVNRDILGFGLGAKPVANFYGFCLAEPNDKTKLFRDKELKQPMLSARRIMDGVIAGINSGGNQSGIPTPLGFLYFDPRFRGKPMVFAGTLGLIPKKIGANNSWQKQAKNGDLIVVVGGRVGLDGIHGATFSSESLDTHSPSAAVQIGDPITQKKFSDAIVKEARAQNLYNSITDCGAGGISSAVGEMAKESGGCLVKLDKVPLKYPGLSPWQIWISESQERMVLAVPKNKWQKFQKLMSSRGIEASAIGEFTNSGKCIAKYGKDVVMEIEMEFLHNGRPKSQLRTEAPDKQFNNIAIKQNNKRIDYKSSILNLLSTPGICSTEFVSKQYDHEVQSSSIQKPLQGAGLVNADSAVFRPVLSSKKGVVISYGLNPNLSETNPYDMAAVSIDTAIRSAVATGANPDELALLDNFCWCSPEDPQRLWQLKEAARACYDYAVDFGAPFISGKDSMHNDFKGFSAKGGSASGGNKSQAIKISIKPTLLISAVSVIPDIEKTVSLDAKMPGDLLYVLGGANNEPIGSTPASPSFPKRGSGGVPPNEQKVDALKNLKLYKNFFKAVQRDLIASSISINKGGLAIALAKTLIGGGLGAEINFTDGDLFSENAGRILVSIAPHNKETFENIFHENKFALIGKALRKPEMTIKDKENKIVVKLSIEQLEKAYKGTFKDF